MPADFWTTAWAFEDRVRTASTEDDVADLVHTLQDDLVLQRYLFTHRLWAVADWLPRFRIHGLFTSPPPVERLPEGTIRTQGWPAMQYLKAVAPDHPAEVAALLAELNTENWWVIADGLDIAAALPDPHAGTPIVRLLALWHAAPVTWTHPDTIAHSLMRLSEVVDAPWQLPATVARVVDKLWGDSGSRYELEETLDRLGQAAPAVRYQVADGIEVVLASRRRHRRWSVTFAPRLEDLDADRSEPSELLASRWLALVEDETKVASADAGLIRAVRLMAVDDGLVAQMGLRMLRHVLAEQPTDPIAVRLLVELAQAPDVLSREREISELLALFRAHFNLLATELQAEFTGRLLTLADSEKIGERAMALDWLHALRSYLGPREHVTADALALELGPPRDRFEAPRVVASFIGSKGPVTAAEAAMLAPTDLLALMRSVPRVGGEFHDRSVEAIAAQVKAEVIRRTSEFLPLLPEIAATVRYPAILHHIVWALEEAFRAEERQSPEALEQVTAFLRDVGARASGGVLDRDDTGYGTRSVLKAIGDLVEELAPWVLTAPDPTALLAALDAVLESDDPTPDHERQFGGENMDPPTLGLNTARGRGTRALLRLLTETSSPDVAYDQRITGLLETRVLARAEAENSPSVISSFGLYLPWLVTRHADLWTQLRSRVLPAKDREPIWEAVFATFVMFNHPHRGVAASVRDDYERAIDRLRLDRFGFLRAHADRLLAHLIALALPASDSSTGWLPNALAGLDAAPPSEAQKALASLGHAIKRESLAVDPAWILDLVRGRLEQLQPDAGPRRHEEATGLLDLVLAVGVPPSVAGGEILGLMYGGATVRTWTVVEYLMDHDRPRSGIGVQILHRALDDALYEVHVRDTEQFRELVSDYAASVPEKTWDLVNRLGELGFFFVEGIARSLANVARP